MNRSAAIAIIVLVIVVIGAVLVLGSKKSAAPTTPEVATSTVATTSPSAPTARTDSQTPSAGTHAPVTITYGPDGFSPKSVTVPAGTTITWMNQSGGPMWVAVGMHPIHTLYDGTTESQHCANGKPVSSATFDECSTGSSFSFTPTKAGAWPYHNHAHASDFGSITVTP